MFSFADLFIIYRVNKDKLNQKETFSYCQYNMPYISQEAI